MHRKLVIVLMAVLVASFVAVPGFAQETDMVLCARVGIPTDTLVNIEDLFSWGIAAEVGLARQVGAKFILGGQACFGWSFGKVPYIPEDKRQIAIAARAGYGSLEGFSISALAGIVYFLEGDTTIIPDLGLSIDYGIFSLGLSTGAVSLGVNIGL